MDPTGGKSDRLLRLYPKVDESETPLPRSWNPKDKYTFLGLSNTNLKVHYKGSGSNHKDAASVRASHPIPAACGVYYFEIRVVSKGRDGYMGIGLSCLGVNLNRLPGWEKNSYGYHADDGCLFSSSATGQTYGPTFTTGDVVGCGLNFISRSIFFTKNGINLGTAISDLPASLPLYPAVGLQTPGEIIETNFGESPFVFDFEGMFAEMQQQTRQSIEDSPLTVGQGAWQSCLHQLVLGYLVHHGYYSTALTFASSTSQTINEDVASIKNRQRIQACVLRGHVSEALKLVRLAYPTLLDNNKELLFKLKCRQFVEMIGGYDRINTDVPRLSCTSELGSSSEASISPPAPRHVTTPPSHDVGTPLSPHTNDSNQESVFDNGESDLTNGDGVAMEVDPPLPTTSTSFPRQYSGQDRLHSGQDRLHSGQDRLHSGQDGLHAGQDRLHSGQDRLQTGCSSPETFELNTEQIKHVLTFGKDLQRLYNSLTAQTPNEKFKVLLQDSFSLLAYTDPKSSPVSYLLDPLQREPVSAALNSAILESLQLPGQPPLEFALGQAAQCLKFMSHNGVGTAAFTGVQDIINS